MNHDTELVIMWMENSRAFYIKCRGANEYGPTQHYGVVHTMPLVYLQAINEEMHTTFRINFYDLTRCKDTIKWENVNWEEVAKAIKRLCEN